MSRAKFEALLIEFSDASFDCGAFEFGQGQDEDYEILRQNVKTKKKLLMSMYRDATKRNTPSQSGNSYGRSTDGVIRAAFPPRRS